MKPAHASTSPITFFNTIISYGYREIETYEAPLPQLRDVNLIKMRRFLINLAKRRWHGQIIKWVTEKYIDPLITQVFKKSHVSHNEVMHDSVKYLQMLYQHQILNIFHTQSLSVYF